MSRLIPVGNYFNAHIPFETLFDEVITLPRDYRALDFKFQKGDVLLFGGGEDISPSLYNQKPSMFCGAGVQLSNRDYIESEMFTLAEENDIPMIGICRGAQLVCALSGGSLYQHVDKHAGSDHLMTTSEGTVLNVCSAHHQMMNPLDTKHEILAWSTEVLSNVHIIEGEKNLQVDMEPEVVFFKKTKALGIQYHPEFMALHDDAVEYARQLVLKYCL
jgi:putative glutamine amidotransferase